MHRSVALVALLVAPLVLSGCSTGSCVDYIALDTPQARFEAATVVVVASVRGTDRTVEPGAVYRLHRARIEQVLKGRLAASATDVYAPSDQCTRTGQPAEYLDGDPLDGAGRAVLYLAKDPATRTFQLVAPGAVDPLPAGSQLPFSTTSPTASATTSAP